MMNVSEVLINVVKSDAPNLLGKAHMAGSSTWRLGDADITAIGEKTPSNPPLSELRNWVSLYRRPGFSNRGRRTARNVVVGAGRGGHKKRRLGCNGRDRGLDVTPRESGQTCDWSLLARSFGPPSASVAENQTGKAGFSVAAEDPTQMIFSSEEKLLSNEEVIMCSNSQQADSGTFDVGRTSHAADWHSIDWRKVETNVRRLQIRIAKAGREGNRTKVAKLQRFLTRSFCGRALAVRRVTENRGKRTSGIDKRLWDTPKAKWEAIGALIKEGYKASPLRRVYIPKANGKKRPLGIPTMKDRAMQALHLLALQPLSENAADPNSYGFRIGRSTHDAIAQVKNLLDKKGSAQWILEADIAGCFDAIDHDWLLTHVPMDRAMLQKWLKAGVVDLGVFQRTRAGTPQGGIISPTLANLALDGLEAELEKAFGSRRMLHRRHKRNKVGFVRYADDFIITGSSPELLEREVKPLVVAFLSRRGLKLSEEKTKITHIDEGFDFLGWNVRKFGKKTILIKPSKKNLKAFLDKCRDIIKSYKTVPQVKLIWKLNPILRGWSNYHRSETASETFNYVDHVLWKHLWKWGRRRHPAKGARWVKARYFTRKGASDWIFAGDGINQRGEKDHAELMLLRSVKIRRHHKIRMEANPFDPEWDAYFEERNRRSVLDKVQHRVNEKAILSKLGGRCYFCHQPITLETGLHLHHLTPRQEGGKDTYENLVPTHPVCHQQWHAKHGVTNRSPRRAA